MILEKSFVFTVDSYRIKKGQSLKTFSLPDIKYLQKESYIKKGTSSSLFLPLKLYFTYAILRRPKPTKAIMPEPINQMAAGAGTGLAPVSTVEIVATYVLIASVAPPSATE